MIIKLIMEVLIMWILYAIYMAILVHGKGPVGGIFFYPMAMQDRVVKLIPFSVPVAAIVGGIYFLIGKIF